MRELLRRLHYLLHRRRFDDELAAEMAAHRDMAAESGGMPLGDPLRLREDSRETWGFMWLDRLGQDLRYSWRTMSRSPGFAAAAVLVLAVGIGATVAAFSAFNMVELRTLPVRDPQTLVRLARHAPSHVSTSVAYPAVTFYREHSRTLSAVFATTASRMTLEDSNQTRSVFFVTANFFDELGGRPAVGRLFDARDDRSGAPTAVVVSHRFWVTHFGADASVVGRVIRLNGAPVTIIGVAAREFAGLGGDDPALWAPIEHYAEFVRGSRLLTDFSSGVTMWARLSPGISPRAAEDELATLTSELRRQHPDDIWDGERLVTRPAGAPELLGATAVFTLVGVLSLLILAVACGNLGSLLLARGASRQREMALRVAIGAGYGRLVRQLFTESLVLAMMGCAIGLGLGSLVLKFILSWTDAPGWLDPTPDWRVVTFAVAMGLVSAVLFGLSPALYIARQKKKKTFVRTLLIGAQVAASCVLLIVAGLLTRAVERATTFDPGFEYSHVAVIEPSLSEHGYTADRARDYIQDVRTRLRAIAGVEDVSVTSTPPFGGMKIIAALQVEGRPLTAYIHQVDPHYLATMRIALVRGRNLMDGDAQSIVVSESLGAKYWAGGDPLGQPLRIGDETFTVVGVARSARSLEMQNPNTVELYRLARDRDLTGLSVVARTAVPTETVASELSNAVNAVDPNLKPRVQLLNDQFHQNLRDAEQGAVAVGVLGMTALAVACLGVVGLMAYSVAARTQEIGIRIALGAQPRHVLGSLSRQFLGTVIGGLVVGIAGAAALAQLLRSVMYGVSTIDPIAYLAAIALFLFAISLAALWPARRALRVDPLLALRS